MPVAKIAVSIDRRDLQRVDRLIRSGVFPSRSGAFQQALHEKLDRLDRVRLALECSKLDPSEERNLAEERWFGDDEWLES